MLFHRRSSLVMQAVLKWKLFTKKGTLKEEEKQQEDTHFMASSSSTLELGQDNQRQEDVASKSPTPTVALNTEDTTVKAIAENQSLHKTDTKISPQLGISTDTFSNVSMSKSSTCDIFVSLNMQQKIETESKPECNKDILENSTSAIIDGQPIIPAFESEKETCISSSIEVPDSRTVAGNPWVLTEREKRIRSRSRDRKDSFRNNSKNVHSQPSLRSSSKRSRCSSLPADFSLGSTKTANIMTLVSDTQGNYAISTNNVNITSESLHRLSLTGDADEQVEETGNKPSARRGSKLKKEKKNAKYYASFRIFRWVTSIRRRRRRR